MPPRDAGHGVEGEERGDPQARAGSGGPGPRPHRTGGRGQALLEAADVVAGYGQTEILHGVSIFIDQGEVVTIIGPNGCGKSTLMKAIVGLVRVRTGSVTFQGTDISGYPPERIVRTGLCYVPQTNNVFPSLTIRENLEMGAFIRSGAWRKDDYRDRIGQMFDLFPDLAAHPGRKAGSLSGGQRQMLAIARALMLDPVMLLLDEPSAGLSPAMMQTVFDRIREINESGVALLLVEQNARDALGMSDRGYILVAGEKRLEDTGKDLLNNPEVASLYLGG